MRSMYPESGEVGYWNGALRLERFLLYLKFWLKNKQLQSFPSNHAEGFFGLFLGGPLLQLAIAQAGQGNSLKIML